MLVSVIVTTILTLKYDSKVFCMIHRMFLVVWWVTASLGAPYFNTCRGCFPEN